MSNPRRARVALVLAASLATGCVQEAERNPLDEAGGGGACRAGSLRAAEVLDCLGPSVALIATPLATGSAVLVDGGYVVTNAHVVDPFETASVTFPDAPTLVDVPVVGIDAFADIAVLGPVETDRSPAELVSGAELERGDDVFLVGYPGEVEDAPEVTISRGVLSRTRRAGDFDLTYLQTDASIGGGQSGGALVDARGRLVGISGLAFAEQFALALDGADVRDSIERILAGEGDAYRTLPDGAQDRTDHHIELQDEMDAAAIVVQAQDDASSLRIELPPTGDIAVQAVTLDGEPLLVNDVAAAQLAAIDDLDVQDDLGFDVATPTAPGVYDLEVPPSIEVLVSFGTSNPSPVGFDVRTSLPATALERDARRPLRSGDVVSGILDQLEIGDTFAIDLAPGDSLELLARSPSSDMAIYVRPPGAALEDVEYFDDGGGGLYDYDAVAELVAETGGTYVVVVTNLDVVVTGYELDVTVS